jgi:hypothetical protein
MLPGEQLLFEGPAGNFDPQAPVQWAVQPPSTVTMLPVI